MANSNLMALQATTNRFAKEAGFPLLVVDGGMGGNTSTAVARALQFVADGGGGFLSNLAGGKVSSGVKGIAAGFAEMLPPLQPTVQATVIMQNVTKINQVLTAAANELALPSASSPPKPAVSSGGFATTNPTTLNTTLTPPPPPGKRSVLARIGGPLGLSSTQTVLFLAMLGGVGFLAVRRMRARA